MKYGGGQVVRRLTVTTEPQTRMVGVIRCLSLSEILIYSLEIGHYKQHPTLMASPEVNSPLPSLKCHQAVPVILQTIPKTRTRIPGVLVIRKFGPSEKIKSKVSVDKL